MHSIPQTMHKKTSKRLIFALWSGGISFLLLSVLCIYGSQNISMNQLGEESSHKLDIYQAFLTSELKKFQLLAKILSEDSFIKSHLKQYNPTDIEAVHQYLSAYKHTTQSLNVLLFDLDGKVISASDWQGDQVSLGKNFNFRPYFQESRKGGVGSYLAVGLDTNKAGYFISYPVWDQENMLGVVAVKFNLDGLEPDEIKLDGDKFFIADENGVIFTGNDERFKFKSITTPNLETYSEIRTSKRYADKSIKPLGIEARIPLFHTAIFKVLSYNYENSSEKYLFFYRTLSQFNWTIYLFTDLREYWEKVLTLSGMLIFFLGLLLAILAFLLQRTYFHREMYKLAIRDPLTKLYTRLYWEDAALALLESHRRGNIKDLSLILFDLDHFKKVNDTYGHKAGDLVLAKVGEVILHECRTTDLPVRFGGEELMVFMLATKEQAFILAERIRKKVEGLEIEFKGQKFRLTLSGGISNHRPGEPLDRFIQDADQLLYKAKEGGRNKVLI